MNPRNWLITTVGVTAVVVACVAGVNAALDPYGIFRDPTGRNLPGYGEDRLAKYLLNTRYVPANFDSLLVGPSVSGNWPVGNIKGLNIYNESLSGGDIAELKSLVDNSIASWRPKAVLLIVTPYVTLSHEFKTVTMTPDLRSRALGSLNLVYTYKEWASHELGRSTPIFDAAGSVDYSFLENKHVALNATLKDLLDPAKSGFDIDPEAMDAYRGLVAELQARKVPIVFIIPPMADELYRPKREAFTTYTNMVLGLRTERDRVIDFTSDAFKDLWSDQADSFTDGVHLHQSAAAKLTTIIGEQVEMWAQESGWLR
jgi:hypothetical protein